MQPISKQQADAYDRILDAAAELAELIQMSGIALEEDVLEELTIFLAKHADEVKRLLKGLKPVAPL